MNLFLYQKFNDLNGPLGFFSDPWRLILLASLPLILVTHYLLPYLVLYYKNEKLYRLMPSPVTSPIFGRILGHVEHYFFAPERLKKLPLTVFFYHFVNELVRPIQKAGESLFLLRLGPFHKWVMVIKGEAAKALLISGKHLQKGPEYKFVKEYIGDSLISGNVADWKIRRKLIAPSFHSEILHKFLPAMNAHSRVFCRVIRSKKDVSTGKSLLPDIRQMTASCTLDILSETTMGVKVNSQEESSITLATQAEKFTELYQLIHTGIDLACARVMTPWFHLDFIYRRSTLGRKTAKCISTGRQFVKAAIGEQKAILSKKIEDCATVEQARARLTDGKRLSFLELLLVNHLKDDGSPFTLTSIEDEVCEFLIGGLDTTSTALQMTILLLGLHQDKQALLHQELDAIFSDDDRDIVLEDLRQMTYLEMCIKEILRLYPGAPIIGRILSEDLQMDKYLVPEGTPVYVNIGAINRDPAVWTQADDFLPERFSPDSSELGLSSSFLTFSAGPRNCLGSRYAMLVLKIFLATLFRHYTVRSVTALEDIQMGFFAFAKPNAPISIEFTPRQ